MKDLFKTLLLCYLITAGVIFPFTSFRSECKHIFVATESETVGQRCEIKRHNMIPRNWDYVEPEIGSHSRDHNDKNVGEGISIVCVKCFLQKRQTIHYTHEK
jgi:hypothetical protein